MGVKINRGGGGGELLLIATSDVSPDREFKEKKLESPGCHFHTKYEGAEEVKVKEMRGIRISKNTNRKATATNFQCSKKKKKVSSYSLDLLLLF